MKSSRLLLVLIGSHWLSSTDGKSHIGDRTDYVTKELEIAIENDVPIIPVLLDGAPLPEEDVLPAKLARGLLRRNTLEVRHSSFERDCMFLTERIYSYLGVKPPTKLEELLETFANKFGYSGFRYDEKARSWHAVLALGFGGMATVLTLLGLAGMVTIDLEIVLLTACSAFPGVIGKNSSAKGTLAKIGLFLSLASFLVQFVLLEYHEIGSP